jgi:hypothetical protein
MALFTDPEVITLDDLLPFENSLVEVSSTHGIDVEAKIAMALSTVGDRLMLRLLRAGAADPQNAQRRSLGLSTVVLTPVLSRWLCFEALTRIYAEAYNVQLNTRFQGKWTEYKQQAAEAADLVFSCGIGMVAIPLARPAKPIFENPNASLPEQAVYIQATWVGARNEESAPSPINACILNGSQGLSVAMDLSQSPIPATAIGWNLYASNSQATISKQNNSPIAVKNTWTLPSSGLTNGTRPSGGQQAATFITFIDRLQRG